MLPWWGKSSSKEGKKKPNRESFIETIHRKFRITSEDKSDRSSGSHRRCDKYVLERGSRSRVPSRSSSPSKLVLRCQSFADRPQAHPLPLPGAQNIAVGRGSSGVVSSVKHGLEEKSKPALCLPLPEPGFVSTRLDQAIAGVDLATASVSSESSSYSEDQSDSHMISPLTSDYENGNRTAVTSPSSFTGKDQFSITNKRDPRDILKFADPPLEDLSAPFKLAATRAHVQNLQIPHRGAFFSATDSSRSSPSRSSIGAFGTEQVLNCGVWVGKTYTDVGLLGSEQCSSPGSGQTSGHNSIGGDILGQLLWPNCRCSPECSPVPSPKMTSPGPSSRVNSGAVSPLHPRAGIATMDSPASWLDDVKQQSHRLPLPPLTISNTCSFSPTYSTATSPSLPRSPNRAETISNTCSFSPTYSTATSPSLPRSPNRAENPPSPGSRWKKGRLLGRGTFGDVYLGFNSESGEMCAMKEVTLGFDDAKSKESAQRLGQEIATLSRLCHPNIVRYYGSEMVDDKIYIYLEYVSGGSIYKLLQEYGQFGEVAIRSYTRQILSGLAYLHAKNTSHRDIKGANILVDPNGRVKLADFGMAKHITGQYSPLSFKGSPNWMAPEMIKNSNGCNLAVDIWSLGCTVLEMATTKPPWSQFEGVAAMFKIGNSKELPAIPNTLSDEAKDFIRQCLQRNPQLRPTAAKLMDHPFVKNVGILERPDLASEPSEAMNTVARGIEQARNISGFHSERVAMNNIRLSRGKNFGAGLSDVPMMKNASCPVSPVGSPLLSSRSSQHLSGRISPISASHAASGSSTPCVTGHGITLCHHHSQQPTNFLQESMGAISRYHKTHHINSSNTYHKARPVQYLEKSQASHVLQETISSDNATPGGQLGQSSHGNHRSIHHGQSALADCVAVNQTDHGKLKSTVELNPCSSEYGQTNGI